MYRRLTHQVAANCTSIIIASIALGSAFTNGPGGIDSAGLMLTPGVPLDGDDISIGQVEPERPGKAGFDNNSNANFGTTPLNVYVRRGLAPTANSMPEIFDLSVDPPDAHATKVAGVMIGTDPAAPGVAPSADLYAAGFNVGPANAFPEDTQLTMQFIATRDLDDVRAINLSYTQDFDPARGPDGNSSLAQFVDWSAGIHNLLYVTAIPNVNLEGNPFESSPSENFNGLTVAASARVLGGAYRKVDDFADLTFDATGDRTSIDILAPGVNVAVADAGGDPDAVASGSSFAAPHVTGTIALLHQFGDAQTSPHFDGFNARRHEVIKNLSENPPRNPVSR